MTKQEWENLKVGDLIKQGPDIYRVLSDMKGSKGLHSHQERDVLRLKYDGVTPVHGRAVSGWSWDLWHKHESEKDPDVMEPATYVILQNGHYTIRHGYTSYSLALAEAKEFAKDPRYAIHQTKFQVARVCTTVEVTCKEVQKVVKEKVYETSIKIHRS